MNRETIDVSNAPISVMVGIEVQEGQVWTDPEGTSWRVIEADATVTFERTDVTHAPAANVVRQWTRHGDAESAVA